MKDLSDIVKRRIDKLKKTNKLSEEPKNTPENDLEVEEVSEVPLKVKKPIKDKRKRMNGYDNRPSTRRCK